MGRGRVPHNLNILKILSMRISIKQLFIGLLIVIATSSCRQDDLLVNPTYNNCLEVKFVDKDGNNLLTLKGGQRSMIFDNFEVYRSCSPDFKEKRIKMSIGHVLNENGDLALEENRFAQEYCGPFGWPLYQEQVLFMWDESADGKIFPWPDPETNEIRNVPFCQAFLLGFCFGFAKDPIEGKKNSLVRYRLVWPEGNREWIIEHSYDLKHNHERFFVDNTEYTIDSSSQQGRTVEIVID